MPEIEFIGATLSPVEPHDQEVEIWTHFWRRESLLIVIPRTGEDFPEKVAKIMEKLR